MPDVVIRIQGVSLWAHHGLDSSEEEHGGPFLVGFEAAYPEPSDPLRDSVESRPDYAAMTDLVVRTFLGPRFRLIEPLAAVIAETLLVDFPEITRVTVSIRKLRPVIEHVVDHVEVVASRTRRT